MMDQNGVDSLRTILQHLLSDPDLAAKYETLAQQRASQHYNWEAVTNAYERLFHQVCQTPLPDRLQ